MQRKLLLHILTRCRNGDTEPKYRQYNFVTSPPVAATVTHAGSITVTSPPVTGTVTWGQNVENIIVASSTAARSVTQSQDAGNTVVTSSQLQKQ